MLNPHAFESGDSILFWDIQEKIKDGNIDEAIAVFHTYPHNKQVEKLDNLITVFGWDEEPEFEACIRKTLLA